MKAEEEKEAEWRSYAEFVGRNMQHAGKIATCRDAWEEACIRQAMTAGLLSSFGHCSRTIARALQVSKRTANRRCEYHQELIGINSRYFQEYARLRRAICDLRAGRPQHESALREFVRALTENHAGTGLLSTLKIIYSNFADVNLFGGDRAAEATKTMMRATIKQLEVTICQPRN